MAKTLYLIDGHAQFFRAYHAIRTPMTSPVTKEPTQMTYGFVGMLLKVLRDYKPDYLAVVIDISGDRESFRSQIFPEYKANREKAPEDFGPQVDRCLSILGQFGVPVYGESGVEADDVIASIVDRLGEEDPDLNVRIVSRDKDLTQILRPGVELFDVHKDTSVSPSDVFKTEGVQPEHVVDILALMGDNVDNVPGVPGIGPKTAAKLILDYGSIENLYDHIEEIKGKRRENLEAARDAVPLSRSLVELKRDMDVPFDLGAAVVDASTLPVGALHETFRELNFRTHVDTLDEITGSVAPPAATTTSSDPMDGGLFGGLAGSEDDAPVEPTGTYRVVESRTDLEALVQRLQAAPTFALDVVTDNPLPRWGTIVGFAFATEVGAGEYVAMKAGVIDALRPVLEREDAAKIGPSLKHAMIALREVGVSLRGALFDTMVASYVLDATRSSHEIDVLAHAFLNRRMIDTHEMLGRGRDKKTLGEVAIERLAPWAAERADLALQLHDLFTPKLEDDGLMALFRDTEMALVPVLAELEYNGVHVDPAELDRQREKLEEQIAGLRAGIEHAAPHPFSPDSPKQLAAVLFNPPEDADAPGLGLKVLKKGKTGPSTDQEVLEKLAEDPGVDTPIPQLIVEYRQLTKLVGTYLESLKQYIHPETGRIHALLNQTVAATGRLSSSDPNLQNIPIRTEVGREIRRAFTAEPGNVLVTADYSQIELRLLAHLAEDPGLIESFRRGDDIHVAVAAEVFEIAPEDVTYEQRSTAKMINFGIVYGITAYGLARRLGKGMTTTLAQQIIDDYKARYHKIDAFLAECIARAHTHGSVETILGRRRLIPQVASRRVTERAYGERMAINTVVQGSAADLIKIAMIDLHGRLPEGARMVLQIHDELVFEAPEALAEELAAFAAERMKAAMELKVPIEVNTAWSTSWIDA